MTHEELKAMVIEAAKEYRDACNESDGDEHSDFSTSFIKLCATVGACRIVGSRGSQIDYIWTLDPDPRREADERLWAEISDKSFETFQNEYFRLKSAMLEHGDAIQAIDAQAKPAD